MALNPIENIMMIEEAASEEEDGEDSSSSSMTTVGDNSVTMWYDKPKNEQLFLEVSFGRYQQLLCSTLIALPVVIVFSVAVKWG